MEQKFIASRISKINFEINELFKPEGEVQLTPSFNREVKKQTNGNNVVVILRFSLKSTVEKPLPFNIFIEANALFSVEFADEFQEKKFYAETTKYLYQNISSVLLQLTQNAGMPPYNLPVLTQNLFPEDNFVVSGNND